MKRYNKNDVGCYADGGFGHEHVRERLALLISPLDDSEELVNELNSEPTDDMSEEDDAIEMLNDELCDEDVCFHFVDGDLVLLSVEEF